MTKTFGDLEFKPHPNWTGVQALMFFDNGYGVSVIQADHSYGGADGKYELAVGKGSSEDWDLCYDTPVTDDVLGHLSPDAVTSAMAQVQALPSAITKESN